MPERMMDAYVNPVPYDAEYRDTGHGIEWSVEEQTIVYSIICQHGDKPCVFEMYRLEEIYSTDEFIECYTGPDTTLRTGKILVGWLDAYGEEGIVWKYSSDPEDTEDK